MLWMSAPSDRPERIGLGCTTATRIPRLSLRPHREITRPCLAGGMEQKGELVASVLEQVDGRVVLVWYHRGRLELTDLPTVGDAIRSVDEIWVTRAGVK